VQDFQVILPYFSRNISNFKMHQRYKHPVEYEKYLKPHYLRDQKTNGESSTANVDASEGMEEMEEHNEQEQEQQEYY